MKQKIEGGKTEIFEKVKERLIDLYGNSQCRLCGADWGKLGVLLEETYRNGWNDAKKPINEHNHKLNRQPRRIAYQNHRYHLRVEKYFDECPFCNKDYCKTCLRKGGLLYTVGCSLCQQLNTPL